jgi:hypothetical protein
MAARVRVVGSGMNTPPSNSANTDGCPAGSRMREMERRFQFSLRNVLLATALIALWCGVIIQIAQGNNQTVFERLFLALPIAAAFALHGRVCLGLFVGIVGVWLLSEMLGRL